MQIGFVNFSQDDLAKKNKVLQMVRDQAAVDELGFGRIRDAFANLMFPGMSTLQRRAKYFVVMPSLFYQATKKHYNNVRDVRSQIIRWEIRLTDMLMNDPNNDKIGITGSSMLEAAKKDSSKFVKYDPTYIYMNGLRTYGMVKSESDIYRLIYERSKNHDIHKSKYKATDTDEMSDSDDLGGNKQFFSVSGEDYHFDDGIALSLNLTKKEADYLKNHIITSPKSSDSLLSYILLNDIDILPEYDALATIWEMLPEKYWLQYRMGRRFAHLAYVVNLRYNHIAATFNGQYEECTNIQKEIEETISKHPVDFTYYAIEEMLFFIRSKVTEESVITFTKRSAKLIETRDWTGLDNLIVAREKSVKTDRSKLQNPKFKGEKRGWQRMFSFRWDEIVYKVITEIREAK